MTALVAFLYLFFASPPANQPPDPATPGEWYCYSAYEVMLPDSIDFVQLMDNAVLTDVIVAPHLFVQLRFETANALYRNVHVYFMNLNEEDGRYFQLQAETLALLTDDNYPRVTFQRSRWIESTFTYGFHDNVFTLQRQTFGRVFYDYPRLVNFVQLRRENK